MKKFLYDNPHAKFLNTMILTFHLKALLRSHTSDNVLSPIHQIAASHYTQLVVGGGACCNFPRRDHNGGSPWDRQAVIGA